MQFIYNQFSKDIQKIPLGSIKFLTSQLESFIEVYEKNVYISSEEDKQRIHDLKCILNILKNERYEELINCPGRIIDYSDDNEEYLPSYYPL